MRLFRRSALCLALVTSLFATAQFARAEVTAGSSTARPLITQPVDDSKLVTLEGNTRPETRVPANDRGALSADFKMPEMQLLLNRSPEQEKALIKLMDEQQIPGNANYHHWLTNQDLQEKFGVSEKDIQVVKAWLQSRALFRSWEQRARSMRRSTPRCTTTS